MAVLGSWVRLPYTLRLRNDVKSVVCSFIQDRQFEPSDNVGRLDCFFDGLYVLTLLLDHILKFPMI